MSSAMRSMTFNSSALEAVMLSLSRTAFSAHSTLRARRSAMPLTKAAVSFSTFFNIVSSAPFFSLSDAGSPMPTGWAAPMLLEGAIAATCAARVRKTPAEPARAPGGPTQKMIGTLAESSACTMSRVEESRPPGVSSRTTSASTPLSCASRIASMR